MGVAYLFFIVLVELVKVDCSLELGRSGVCTVVSYATNIYDKMTLTTPFATRVEVILEKLRREEWCMKVFAL